MEVDILQKMGIPSAFLEANLPSVEKWLSSSEYSKIQEFLSGRIQGLFFSSKNGSGKSYTGCAVIKHMAEYQKKQCFRSSVSDLVHSYTENSWKIPGKFLQPAVLFLEELGKEFQAKSNDLSTSILESLIKYRSDNNKKTIYSANVDILTLETIYGATVKSMILGTCKKVNFPNVDRRIKSEFEAYSLEY